MPPQLPADLKVEASQSILIARLIHQESHLLVKQQLSLRCIEMGGLSDTRLTC